MFRENAEFTPQGLYVWAGWIYQQNTWLWSSSVATVALPRPDPSTSARLVQREPDPPEYERRKRADLGRIHTMGPRCVTDRARSSVPEPPPAYSPTHEKARTRGVE